MKKKITFYTSYLAIFLVIVALSVSFIKYYNYLKLQKPEPHDVCKQKFTVLNKNTYLLDNSPDGDKIVLKIINRNDVAWYELLQPLKSPNEQFKTCIKAITKLPDHVENDSIAGKERKEKSNGLQISIGIQKPFTYKPIANVTFNIELYADKFRDEPYNLDAALQNIADSYLLTQNSNGDWHLIFNAPLGDKFDQELPFYYEFARLNNKEINRNSAVEFVSTDQGKTWQPIIGAK